MSDKISSFKQSIIDALNLNIKPNTDIYIGESNIKHMKQKHPAEYQKYGNDIEFILSNPDYVGINKKDNSIEFVKEYKINNDFVKVAVRVSLNNKYYVRSIYVLNNKRVQNFINKGTLVKP